jgi:hypothetical protein
MGLGRPSKYAQEFYKEHGYSPYNEKPEPKFHYDDKVDLDLLWSDPEIEYGLVIYSNWDGEQWYYYVLWIHSVSSQFNRGMWIRESFIKERKV